MCLNFVPISWRCGKFFGVSFACENATAGNLMKCCCVSFSYQAVECFLANVQPVHPLEDGQWNHNAVNKFEEITNGKYTIRSFTMSLNSAVENVKTCLEFMVSVAKWKKLIAKTVKTRERFRGYDTNTSESSTIPGIELYDVIDGKFIFKSKHSANKLLNDFLISLISIAFVVAGHEVNLASILILENFAVPANQDDAPTPLSRYSSSESVVRLDGGPNTSGSVAEKAMMFELTANMQNSRYSPKPKSNGTSDGQKSPARFSSSPRRTQTNDSTQKEQATVNSGDEKQTNFQDMLNEHIMNRSWGDIMDSES